MLTHAARSLAMLLLILLAVAAAPAPASAQVATEQRTPLERLLHEWEAKLEKMETRLQPAMRDNGIDMWIIFSREFNVDPVLQLFGGYGISGWYGHRNVYILRDPGQGQPLERVLIGTHQSGRMRDFFPTIIGYGEEGFAGHLREYIERTDPQRIAVNRSRTVAMADGLTAEMATQLEAAVGPKYVERMVPSQTLLFDYAGRRTAAEVAIETEASQRTWFILRRAFSNEVITPGITTLMDVYGFILAEWHRQDLEFNFSPGLTIYRKGVEGGIDDTDNPVIEPGDMLHVDFGVRLMGLVTDQQHLAYVLREGEDAAGIQASIYGHTQGHWVHGAGARTVFDWPERYGDFAREPVRAGEFWSIEYSVQGEVPEWGGQTVRIAREEDAAIDADGTPRWLVGPQMRLWLIRSEPGRGGA